MPENGKLPPHPPNLVKQPLERRLATILCADVAGYSKMMASSEERTVHVFRGHREIFESLVNLHRGRIFNTAGDALLAEFNSPVEAVRCATEIQAALRTRNENLAPEENMQFRMGINLGDVIIQGGDLLGDGVNVAARIQTATAPGGICISGSVHDQIQNKLSLNFKLLGEQTYKNIAKPVRTYTINEDAAVITRARRTGWRVLAAITAAVLAIAGAGYWGYQQYDAYRIEQHQVETRLAAQMAAQKQATEQAQQTAKAGKKQAAASQHTASTAKAKDAPKLAASHDGTYIGRLCNFFTQVGDKAPVCWGVALVVRNGIAEGSWISRSQKEEKVHGTVAEDGSFQLNLATTKPDGSLVKAILVGRIVDGAIAASGRWSRGGEVAGDWKRTP